MLGRLALKEKDDGSAIRHFSKALELQPDSLEWSNSLGNLFSRNGRFEEALERYNHAMTLANARSAEPGDADHPATLDEAHVTQLSNIHMNLGTLWMRWGQCEDATRDRSKCEQAVVEYGKALELRPAEAGLRFHLGRALAATGRSTEAAAEFRKALELDPDHAGARRELDKLEGKNP
jgi:Flp pilus assembly protein TadD